MALRAHLLVIVLLAGCGSSSTAPTDPPADDAGSAAPCEASMAGKTCVQGNRCAEVKTCDGPSACSITCTRFQLECTAGTWQAKSLPSERPATTDPACAADAAVD